MNPVQVTMPPKDNSVDELVTFLRARFDEDEDCARAAVQTSARWEPYRSGLDILDGLRDRSGDDLGDGAGVQDRDGNLVAVSDGRPFPSGAQVRHIVRHDPARVLQEVAAKRRLVDQLEAACRAGSAEPAGAAGAVTVSEAACLLALPYARHPDYRPDWSPS